MLIGLEALIFSFVLFFFGVGVIFVAIISYFYTFDNAIIQLALSFIIAILGAYLFRNRLLDKISKPSQEKEERRHISGVGYIDEDMVKFDGTYWRCDDDLSRYKNGDRVEVIDVVDNKVIIKAIK
ncbi:nodulation efficiency protein D (NfeD) [hydrothermal vent metagenome]|uniref:Nodulation efficiency protein D (NfeD) n=1 Tax=hydrothermal vent metagenome TaxID=652676 RepID=A0A1W1EJW4_9ZZZZ